MIHSIITASSHDYDEWGGWFYVLAFGHLAFSLSQISTATLLVVYIYDENVSADLRFKITSVNKKRQLCRETVDNTS